MTTTPTEAQAAAAARLATALDRSPIRDRQAALRMLNRPTITGTDANAREGIWSGGLDAIDED